MLKQKIERQNMLKIGKIQKSYGDNLIFEDVSFELLEGECLGIIGENGSGKSTLIECLLQMKDIDAGKIEYNFPLKDLKKKVGVQFQEVYFDPNLKVKEIINLFLVVYQTKIEFIQKYIERLGLEKIMNRYPNKLSGGEKQKLNILLALMNDPEILICDEITTGLDTPTRRSIYDILMELKAQGKTVILVSHYYEELDMIADKILQIAHRTGNMLEKASKEWREITRIGDGYND